MKKTLTLTLTLLIGFVALAQLSVTAVDASFFKMKNINEAGDLSKKTLVVVLQEIPEKKIKRLKKKEKYENAKKSLEKANNTFLAAVKKHWSLGNEIKTSKEVSEEVYSKNSSYLSIEATGITDRSKRGGYTYTYSYSIVSLKCGKKNLANYCNTGGSFIEFELDIAISLMKPMIKAAQANINKRDYPEYVSSKNASELKNKTLLIPDGITKLDEAKIKAEYTNPVKMVSLEEMQEKIKSKDDNYAFYWPQHLSGSCGKSFIHAVYSCADYKPLYFKKSSAIKLGQYGGNAPLFYEILPITGSVPLVKLLRLNTVKKLNEQIGS